MKKIVLLALALALLLSVAATGLAESAAQTETTPAPTWGQQRGRWSRQPGTPPTGFVDEDGDGLCDTCGQTPGQNHKAPGFIDEDKDGVCDHFGTTGQFRSRPGMAQGRMQGMKGHMMRRRMLMMQSQRPGMPGGQGQRRGMMPGAGAQQGPNFADGNKDGICDFFQENNNNNQPGGPGRFRR